MYLSLIVLLSRQAFLYAPLTSSLVLISNKNSPQPTFELVATTICRVTAFFTKSSADLTSPLPEDVTDSYIAIRLATKDLLTSKGASYLSSFDFRHRLAIASSYSLNEATAKSLSQELIEQLASIVEFDGLDQLAYDSPRTSLMMRQITQDKIKYVRRTVATILDLLLAIEECYGEEQQEYIIRLMTQYYPDEVVLDTIAVIRAKELERVKQQQLDLDDYAKKNSIKQSSNNNKFLFLE
ncbi:hypothetical protein ScalyP_jg2158 [Parmales sp. scaly parma]|nr:hypothetical protein ScalyP_jg2158 [Parmales sp. scaly parma]